MVAEHRGVVVLYKAADRVQRFGRERTVRADEQRQPLLFELRRKLFRGEGLRVVHVGLLHLRQRGRVERIQVGDRQVDVDRPAARARRGVQGLVDHLHAGQAVLLVLDDRQDRRIALDVVLRHAAVRHLRRQVGGAGRMVLRGDRDHRQSPVIRLRETGDVIARGGRARTGQNDRLPARKRQSAGEIRRAAFIHHGVDLEERVQLHRARDRHVRRARRDDDLADAVLFQKRQHDLRVFVVGVHRAFFQRGKSLFGRGLRRRLLRGLHFHGSRGDDRLRLHKRGLLLFAAEPVEIAERFRPQLRELRLRAVPVDRGGDGGSDRVLILGVAVGKAETVQKLGDAVAGLRVEHRHELLAEQHREHGAVERAGHNVGRMPEVPQKLARRADALILDLPVHRVRVAVDVDQMQARRLRKRLRGGVDLGLDRAGHRVG